MELYIAIAALCQIPNGINTWDWVAKKHLACQQYYVQCLVKEEKAKRKDGDLQPLAKCILEREP